MRFPAPVGNRAAQGGEAELQPEAALLSNFLSCEVLRRLSLGVGGKNCAALKLRIRNSAESLISQQAQVLGTSTWRSVLVCHELLHSEWVPREAPCPLGRFPPNQSSRVGFQPS